LSNGRAERRTDGTAGRTALITGVAGQDGACLADVLIRKGYSVVGAARSLAKDGLWRLAETGLLDHPGLRLEPLDLVDAGRCMELVTAVKPDEVYNLGGLSFIGQSFAQPLQTAQTTGFGAFNLLEAIRTTDPRIRYFQASSSEMFGNADASPQNEDTPFHPRSPYAVAKLFAHWATVTYRESYGIFACSGILYNHESPLRGIHFVTRKITDAVARIRLGLQEVLELGNLGASRDWGYAPEYADAMWRMLQADSAGTYVLATGRLATVRKFAEAAFRAAGIELRWQGEGIAETGVEAGTGRPRVRVSPEFFRPAEAHPLCGDPAKAQRLLGWKAVTGVNEICRLMVEADLRRLGGVN
jgi:GDPmannose 4,6-dehydratase